MAYGADDGHFALEDRPRHVLLVERPEVFEGTAPARDDDHVNVVEAFQRVERRNDGGHGLIALHQGGGENQLDGRVAARRHVLNVVPDGAGRRGDDSHSRGESRQGPLAGLLEQALLFEPHPELFELQLKLADALGPHHVGNELKVAARLVEGHTPVGDDGAALLNEVGSNAAVTEHHASERRVPVPQAEVAVSRRRAGEVSDLATHPDVLQDGVFAENFREIPRHLRY